MRLKYQISILNMDDKMVAVPLDSGEEFSGVIKMNETASDILKCLEKDISEDELVARLLTEYDTSEEAMRAAVTKTLETLRQFNLLIES